MEKTELKDYMEKILDFAKAIVLDKKNQSAESIAATMAEEIEYYGTKVLDSLMSSNNQ